MADEKSIYDKIVDFFQGPKKALDKAASTGAPSIPTSPPNQSTKDLEDAIKATKFPTPSKKDPVQDLLSKPAPKKKAPRKYGEPQVPGPGDAY